MMDGYFTYKRNLFAVVELFGGFFLLVAAWKLAGVLPIGYANLLYKTGLRLWIFIICGLWMYCIVIGIPVWRAALVMLALALGVFFPQPMQDTIYVPGFRVLSAQCLSALGMILFLYGSIRWRKAHPHFVRIYDALHYVDKIPARFFISGLATLFLLIAVGLSWYCFAFQPALCDTTAQYVHGKFMAAGHLYWHTHPLDYFFPSSWKIVTNGRWYSPYQPLSIFLLALGHLVHAPWLANPLEGALTLVAVYALAKRVSDEPTARLAAVLTLGSQMLLFMSSEYMNHAGALLFSTLYLWCYIETVESLRIGQRRHAYRWAFYTGLCLSCIFLIRPYTALEIALPSILYSLYLFCRNPRLYFSTFSIITLVMAGCLIFQGWYDLQTSGKIFIMPYAALSGNIPGFNYGHTFWKGLVKAQDEWRVLGVVLFEWSLPCTLFMLIACLFPFENRYLRLLLAVVISMMALNMLNRFEYFHFGPRYIYEMASSILILTAVGIRRIPVMLSGSNVSMSDSKILSGITATAILLLFVGSIVWRLPVNVRMYANHYVNNESDFYFSMMKQSQKPALIFISHGLENGGYYWYLQKYWGVDFANPPEDSAPVIFAIDSGSKNRALIDFYPNRIPYLERNGILYVIDKTKPTH